LNDCIDPLNYIILAEDVQLYRKIVIKFAKNGSKQIINVKSQMIPTYVTFPGENPVKIDYEIW